MGSDKKLIKREEVITTLKLDNDFVFDDEKWHFIGKIVRNKNLFIKKAHDSYRAQRGRCNLVNDIAYKHYGAKNVRHLWGRTEFINWYISELLKRDKWVDPVVSRKNDTGNYRVGNCELLERDENTAIQSITDNKRKAAYIQSQRRRKEVELVNICTGEILNYKSSVIASKKIGKCRAYISRSITKNLMVVGKNGETFKASYV